MFETADHAEIPIPDPFRSHGERAWSYVAFPLHVPWFHLVYRLPLEEGGSLRRSIFLSDVSQLVQLGSEGIELYEVQVVLPGHLTGAGRWTMEPLEEIWQGTEPQAPGQKAFVYVLANGKRYLDSGLTDNEADLLDRQLLFKSSPRKATRRKGGRKE